ncbi:hypothetical protein M885DRAFT_443457 [Pelagophyceae sp. CCMP2097]|nr:hypothetical protein M885DRAFT_443457 [Pelagophyceae sp. CCMP2097]
MASDDASSVTVAFPDVVVNTKRPGVTGAAPAFAHRSRDSAGPCREGPSAADAVVPCLRLPQRVASQASSCSSSRVAAAASLSAERRGPAAPPPRGAAAAQAPDAAFAGFRCPDIYINDFTPLEFQETVGLFQEFDVDDSRTISFDELAEMMRIMERARRVPRRGMSHTLDDARALMLEIDEDESGVMDFDEFIKLLASIKRGDSTLQGFAKLIAQVGETPVSPPAVSSSRDAQSRR